MGVTYAVQHTARTRHYMRFRPILTWVDLFSLLDHHCFFGPLVLQVVITPARRAAWSCRAERM